MYIDVRLVNRRSCYDQAVNTSDIHTKGPRFESQPGSSALGQGALSSLPSLSEETSSRQSCAWEGHTLYTKNKTKKNGSLLAKSREKPCYSGQTVQTDSSLLGWYKDLRVRVTDFSPHWLTSRLPNQ